MVQVAAIQMVSTHDTNANLEEARKLLTEAADAGVKVAVLPENFAVLATSQMLDIGRRESGQASVIRRFLAEQARSLGLWIVGGSVPLARSEGGLDIADRVRAACLVYNDCGEEVARYDKIHLFDAMVEDAHGEYRESDTFEPGDPGRFGEYSGGSARSGYLLRSSFSGIIQIPERAGGRLGQLARRLYLANGQRTLARLDTCPRY